MWVLFIFPPGFVALWDSKTLHRPSGERVSRCLETSLLRIPSWDGSLSLTILSLFLSFIFGPISFRRQWAAFLGGWCPLPAFWTCFVEFARRSNVLSMNLWWRKWSPHPIPLPSWPQPPRPTGHLLRPSKLLLCLRQESDALGCLFLNE